MKPKLHATRHNSDDCQTNSESTHGLNHCLEKNANQMISQDESFKTNENNSENRAQH